MTAKEKLVAMIWREKDEGKIEEYLDEFIPYILKEEMVMNTSDSSALFNMIITDAQNKAYDKILEHILEVKRLTTVEYLECSRLGNEAFKKMGYIEALQYVEEYIKKLEEENK